MPDGSEDDLICIKDILGDLIDFTDWEIAEEIIVRLEDLVDEFFNEDEYIIADDDELLLMIRYHEELVV